MKSNVRIPGPLVIALFAVAFLTILVFADIWLVRQRHMADLGKQEMSLRSDLQRLDTWGRWTMEYVKIDKALASERTESRVKNVYRPKPDSAVGKESA